MLDVLFSILGPVCSSLRFFFFFFVLLLFNYKQQLDKRTKVPTFKIVSVEHVHNASNLLIDETLYMFGRF